MVKLEIARMLVISTAHVSEATADALPRGTADLIPDPELGSDAPDWWPTFARDEGWIFHVPAERSYAEGTPADLVACLTFARSLGVEWLMFDRDADQVDGLEVYEW